MIATRYDATERPEGRHPTTGREELTAAPVRRFSLVASAGDGGDAIDSHAWTGEVEAQRREGRMFVILLAIIVAIAAPFAVWFALYLSQILFP